LVVIYIATPTVTTQAASSVLTTTASLNGNITSTGGENCIRRGFQYGLTTGYGSDTHTDGSYGTGAFSLAIGSLTPGKIYHARAYAINSVGTSYGSDVEFTTSITSPTVTTQAASSVTTNTAILRGTITSTGGANCTRRGFQYGLTTGYGSDTHTDGSYGTGAFSLPLSGLTPGKIYHARSYAVNGVGTSYGSDVVFTMQGGALRIASGQAQIRTTQSEFIYNDSGHLRRGTSPSINDIMITNGHLIRNP
jgi:hypothetical protein